MLAALCVVVLALAACSHGSSAPLTVASTETSPLVNFGALDADWDSHHVPAANGIAGSFDSDPSLPVMRGDQVRYANVQEDEGRVNGFDRFFPAKTNIDLALTLAAKDLPSDADILWRTELSTKNGTCYQVDFVSPTLGFVLANDHQGQVAVVLAHADPGETTTPLETSPDLSTITDAVFAEDPGTTKSHASGC
jgi:hypothetical protein